MRASQTITLSLTTDQPLSEWITSARDLTAAERVAAFSIRKFPGQPFREAFPWWFTTLSTALCVAVPAYRSWKMSDGTAMMFYAVLLMLVALKNIENQGFRALFDRLDADVRRRSNVNS